jgi:hypothetical protein
MSFNGDKRKNLICNFRAPTEDDFLEWKLFKDSVREKGQDVCHVALSLAKAWRIGNACIDPKAQGQVNNIQMTNYFQYMVSKPRRAPNTLCVKNDYKRTISSRFVDAYILDKARRLTSSFSFLDFPDLEHSGFRRAVLRLRRKGEIVPMEQRTNPRFYTLVERKNEYLNVTENNRVKPWFTSRDSYGIVGVCATCDLFENNVNR